MPFPPLNVLANIWMTTLCKYYSFNPHSLFCRWGNIEYLAQVLIVSKQWKSSVCFWATLGFHGNINIKKKTTKETESIWKKQAYICGKSFLPEGEFQLQIFSLLLNWEVGCKNFIAHIKRFLSSTVCPAPPGVAVPQVRNSFAIFAG